MKCSVRAALGRMRSCHATRRTPRAERGIPCHSQSRRQRRRGVRQKRPVRRARGRRQLVHQGLERGASRALSACAVKIRTLALQLISGGREADLTHGSQRARSRCPESGGPWPEQPTRGPHPSSVPLPAACGQSPNVVARRGCRCERARAYPPDPAPGPVGRLGCPCRSRTAILRAGSVSIADAHSQITAAFRRLHEM
jgi:hypothetical protein